MTNRETVRKVYPDAFSYRVASHLVHIRKGNGRFGNLGWGWTVKQAWAMAASKIRNRKPYKPRKVGLLSNAELNSGWKTQAVDHGKADSMAGWPAYLR